MIKLRKIKGVNKFNSFGKVVILPKDNNITEQSLLMNTYINNTIVQSVEMYGVPRIEFSETGMEIYKAHNNSVYINFWNDVDIDIECVGIKYTINVYMEGQ